MAGYYRVIVSALRLVALAFASVGGLVIAAGVKVVEAIWPRAEVAQPLGVTVAPIAVRYLPASRARVAAFRVRREERGGRAANAVLGLPLAA